MVTRASRHCLETMRMAARRWHGRKLAIAIAPHNWTYLYVAVSVRFSGKATANYAASSSDEFLVFSESFDLRGNSAKSTCSEGACTRRAIYGLSPAWPVNSSVPQTAGTLGKKVEDWASIKSGSLGSCLRRRTGMRKSAAPLPQERKACDRNSEIPS